MLEFIFRHFRRFIKRCTFCACKIKQISPINNSIMNFRHPKDTIRSVKEERDVVPEFRDAFERAEWELEQQKLDREWYDNDQGYDEENNPFAQVSSDFISLFRNIVMLCLQCRES